MTLVRGVALATLAALATACGGGSVGPGTVVQQAIESKTPCDLYTNAFFEREAGTSAAAGRADCRQVAARLPSIKATITHVETRGQTAVVTAVAGGRTVVYRLVEQDGRWLIDQLAG